MRKGADTSSKEEAKRLDLPKAKWNTLPVIGNLSAAFSSISLIRVGSFIGTKAASVPATTSQQSHVSCANHSNTYASVSLRAKLITPKEQQLAGKERTGEILAGNEVAVAHKRSRSKSFRTNRAVTAMREIQRKALNSPAAKSLRIESLLQALDLDCWNTMVKSVY